MKTSTKSLFLLDKWSRFKLQIRHLKQSEISIFHRQLPLIRFLAKTLCENKYATKSFSKICLSELTLSFMPPPHMY